MDGTVVSTVTVPCGTGGVGVGVLLVAGRIDVHPAARMQRRIRRRTIALGTMRKTGGIDTKNVVKCCRFIRANDNLLIGHGGGILKPYEYYEKMPNYFLKIMILMIVGIISISVIAFYFNWPIQPLISELIRSSNQAAFIIFGAFVAALCGLFGNALNERAKTAEESSRIANAFYHELLFLKERLSASELADTRPNLTHFKDDNFYFINMPSIYSEKGLYYVLREKMFVLDQETVTRLLRLYPKIEALSDIHKMMVNGVIISYNDSHTYDMIRGILADLDVLLPILKEIADVRDT